MVSDKIPRTAADWFEIGRLCFQKPDGPGAVAAMENVITLDPAYRHPDGDTPYFYLGKIDEMENRIEAAVLNYSRALSINRFDEESLIGRGSCYTVMRRHPEAISDFMRVLRFPDEYRRAPKQHLLYAVAENYRQMKDWEHAFEWGEKALALEPANERHRELVDAALTEIKKCII
jgi:tetratricopeptide (TPR) repeat protein